LTPAAEAAGTAIDPHYSNASKRRDQGSGVAEGPGLSGDVLAQYLKLTPGAREALRIVAGHPRSLRDAAPLIPEF